MAQNIKNKEVYPVKSDFYKTAKCFRFNTNIAVVLPTAFVRAMGITKETEMGILPVPQEKSIVLVNLSDNTIDKELLITRFKTRLANEIYKNDEKKRDETINKICTPLEKIYWLSEHQGSILYNTLLGKSERVKQRMMHKKGYTNVKISSADARELKEYEIASIEAQDLLRSGKEGAFSGDPFNLLGQEEQNLIELKKQVNMWQQLSPVDVKKKITKNTNQLIVESESRIKQYKNNKEDKNKHKKQKVPKKRT